MTTKKSFQPEFSRLVALDTVRLHTRRHKEPLGVAFDAKPAEEAALAKRFSFDALQHLRVEAQIEAAGGDHFSVNGSVSATVTRPHPISGEIETIAIAETFDEVLTTAPQIYAAAAKGGDDDTRDIVELIEGDSIDIGEIASQYLALATMD